MADPARFRTYDYGNFAIAESLDEELEGFAAGRHAQKVWRTFDARPRFGNNYVGLRNRIAILSEAYSYLDFERRVRATEAFVEEIMRFVAPTRRHPHADCQRRCRVESPRRPGRRRCRLRAAAAGRRRSMCSSARST